MSLTLAACMHAIMIVHAHRPPSPLHAVMPVDDPISLSPSHPMLWLCLVTHFSGLPACLPLAGEERPPDCRLAIATGNLTHPVMSVVEVPIGHLVTVGLGIMGYIIDRIKQTIIGWGLCSTTCCWLACGSSIRCSWGMQPGDEGNIYVRSGGLVLNGQADTAAPFLHL